MPESATAALPPAEDPDPPRADGVAHEAAPGPLAGIQGPPAARPRHATRALLRAHLAAAVGTRHRTGRCAACGRLAEAGAAARDEGPATG
ncbi:DUF6274 family protein [Streptomyces albidoflavus]|uniref:DUF6274 family protein n=1 Tax=Streptomyces albidoflavus TaxID=1886 RepID=UPI00339F4667